MPSNIILNRRNPVFDPNYEQTVGPPFGVSPFYAKDITCIKKTWCITFYYIDQYLFKNLKKGVYLFAVKVGFLSPSHPERWKEALTHMLKEQVLPKLPIEVDVNWLYYFIIASFITINELPYWKKCHFNTVVECVANNEYCNKAHGDLDPEYPEIGLTGYCRDGCLPKSWRWLLLVEDAEILKEELYTRVKYHIDSVLKHKEAKNKDADSAGDWATI